MPTGKTIEVRCEFCASHPLLAMCGRDRRSGEPFIHVKSWKGQRLYTEVVVTSGTAHLRCRSCFRWTRIRIVRQDVHVKGERLPETISV